jgi:hypothetical protein
VSTEFFGFDIVTNIDQKIQLVRFADKNVQTRRRICKVVCHDAGSATPLSRQDGGMSMAYLDWNVLLMIVIGVGVGIGGAFTGLGGGFLMVPLLLFLGYTAQKAVGTSFLAILTISISALIAHNKLANIDYRAGILLGIGGIVGAQIGARLVEHVPTASFKKIFACVLVGLAAYLFLKK